MRLSVPTLNKLRWILTHPGFRTRPLRVGLRVLGWEFVRLRKARVRIVFDGDLFVSCRWNDGVGRLLYYFGAGHDGTFHTLDRLLLPGMTVVDVGANLGTHTLFAAKRIGENGKVIAFEPDPDMFDSLTANTDGLANVQRHRLAVSSASGMVEFHVNADSAKSSLVRLGGAVARIIVEAVRLDDQVKEPIDFLKIDVEGHELEVLKGAGELLRRQSIKIIHFEALESREEIFSMLVENGYRVFAAEGPSFEIREMSAPQEKVLNFVATHDPDLLCR